MKKDARNVNITDIEEPTCKLMIRLSITWNLPQ
jgi:hypothetical protein